MPIDENLINTMNHYLAIAKAVDPNHSEDWYRRKIVATNLKGLANMLLEAHENKIPADFQQLALGLLGTADWLEPDDDI